MAKSSPGTNPGQIKFRCNVCGTTLKVPIKFAGKYIDCPKCKGRTQVPANQKQADEEARDYDVNRLAFDTTGQCRNCGAKMAKNAVLCTKCGFDYRSGKNVEVVDKTKLPSDYPTWGKIFGAFNDDAVVSGMGKIMTSLIFASVIVFMLGLPITAGLQWWYTPPGGDPPSWPWYPTFVIAGLVLVGLMGTLHESFVSTTSKAIYGKEISVGSVVAGILYFLASGLPALLLPVLLTFTMIVQVKSAEKDPNAPWVEPTFFSSMPLPEMTINQESLVPGMVLVGITSALGLAYYLYSIGSYSVELSVNPIAIFGWIGKTIAEFPIWLGVTIATIGSALGICYGVYAAGVAFEVEPLWVVLGAGLLSMGLGGYVLSVAAFMVGKIFKRHM